MFFLGILIGFSVLLFTTIQDFHDLERVVSYNTPKIFSIDTRFKTVKEKILDRPLYMDPDSYNWIYNATTMVKKHLLRTRFTDSDNVPYGRNVHWSNAYTWYLIGIGKAYSLLTRCETVSSIEKAGRFANSILVGLFGLFWAIILARNFNILVAGIFPLALFLFGAIRPEITFGLADHHALHMLLALSQMLAITIAGVGFVTCSYKENPSASRVRYFNPISYLEARRWFVIASFFGACGLWVGATQQAIIIGLIGAAGALAALFWKYESRKLESKYSFIPAAKLWRWWGYTGALLSLIFYLVEYFPSHMEMQLEVNHPFYAIAWASGAEIIYRICILTSAAIPKSQKYKQLFSIVIAISGVLLLPVAILLGPDSWHFIHDVVTTRTHEFIIEFSRIDDPKLGANFQYFAFRFGIYPFCIIFAAILFFSKRTNLFHKTLFVQSLFITIVLSVAVIFQVRWTTFLSAPLIVMFIILISGGIEICFSAKRKRQYFKILSFAVIVFLLPQWIYQIHLLYFQKNENNRFLQRYSAISFILLSREFAINLEYLLPEKHNRIICDNSFSPMLSFFGVGNTVGSLYWENREGLLDYNLFWSAYTDEEAYKIVQKRGITHVSLQLDNDRLARQTQYIFTGSNNEDDVKRTFAYRLAHNPLNYPSWLEPFPLIFSTQSRKEKIAFYRVKAIGQMNHVNENEVPKGTSPLTHSVQDWDGTIKMP
jgi:hypothetical protein